MSFCIPYLLDVPGLYAPPKWWPDATGLRYNGTPLRTEIDDPRWHGAANRGFGLGTQEEVTFRAGYHTAGGQTSLFFSWHVKYDGQAYDPSGVPDRLWVGLQPSGSGGSPFVLKIDLPHDLVDRTAEAPGPIEIRPLIFRLSDPVGNTPNWVNYYTRVWRKVIETNPFEQEWAINMMVPIYPAATSEFDNAGVNLPTPFRMWYAVDIDTPQRVDSTILSSGVLRVLWPTSATITVSGGQWTIPSPTAWEAYDLGATTDPSCPTTDGLSIDYLNIGTLNTPPQAIKFTPAGVNNLVNTFFARPTNNSGSPVSPHQIKAIFKIANWGSNIAPPQYWRELPHTGDIDNLGEIPAHSTATYDPNAPNDPSRTNQIQFLWTVADLPGDPILSMLRNTRWNDTTQYWEAIDPSQPYMPWHQCMYVQLSGANLVFTKDSVYRNMDFSASSLIQRGAELVTLPGPNRDIYLMLEKVSMPLSMPKGYDEGRFLQTRISQLIEENHGDPILGQKLRKAQDFLSNPPPMSEDVGSITTVTEQYLAALDYMDKGVGLKLLPEFVQALGEWLKAEKENSKPGDPAVRRLANMAGAWSSWLKNHEADPFVEAINQWMSGINEDPISAKLGQYTMKVFNGWLETLQDTEGSLGGLRKVTGSLEAWLDSGCPAEQAPGILSALRDWLSSSGNDKKPAPLELIWSGEEISKWLIGTSERLGQLVSALGIAGLTSSEITQVFPTFRVHVYYDTGDRFEENGRIHAILGLQPSFGIHAYHENLLEGWSTSIHGATRVANNLYVVPASADGSAQISVRIQAAEPGETRLTEDPIAPTPKPTPGCVFHAAANSLIKKLSRR